MSHLPVVIVNTRRCYRIAWIVRHGSGTILAMPSTSQRFQKLARIQSQYPNRDKLLVRIDAGLQILGVIATVIQSGMRHAPYAVKVELGLFLTVAMFGLTASLIARYRWSLARKTFLRNHRLAVLISAVWFSGLVGILVFAPVLPDSDGEAFSRLKAFIALSEIGVLARSLTGVILLIRRATAGATDPAVVLVLSFLVLITIGTTLLMLPKSRAEPATTESETGAPFLVALFTATSASCVTGLIVKDTPTYWSPFGQTVIMALFQIGGLGIMTWGAFFALAAGRKMQFRESATLRDMLESDQLGSVRRLLITILVFTLGAELIGAILISGLWSDLPFAERVRYSLFHSISAFCNAGFALRKESFMGWGQRWEVWGAVTGLIVIGGMGFSVLYNIVLWGWSRGQTLQFAPLFHLPKTRMRLTLTTKLAAGTMLFLLVGGTAGYFILEASGSETTADFPTRLSNAWFQAVTFRTAGFNTVDHNAMQPATKLFAIMLMFIGASPGSTGGGVKTVCFAITVLALLSILRGRDRVEFAGRTIPQELVNRALAIIWLGMAIVMTVTILLVLFEGNPDPSVASKKHFLNYLFEAVSAFGTVGVSTGITGKLSDASQIVIIITMFVGRVGPLTVLMALAGRSGDARYEYPTERVTLG